jgi:hypothetical protein
MKNHVASLASLSLAVACSTDAPTAPAELGRSQSVAGTSNCYTVSGTITQSGLPGAFSGTITGDVIGTVATQTQGTVSHGVVNFGVGQQTWEVTGGIIQELIGNTVRLELRTRVVNAQDPEPHLINRVEIVDGAAKGNLTYHGTLDVFAVPFVASTAYHGVICP